MAAVRATRSGWVCASRAVDAVALQVKARGRGKQSTRARVGRDYAIARQV
jgi:hypothetical protein